MPAGRLFGTDGIRGVANVAPLTPEFLVNLGKAVASSWAAGAQPPRFVVGRDTRISGPMLEAALAAGMSASGAEVLLAGVLPTPAIAHLTQVHKATAGAVISASHNPFADNGVKFFAADGFKLSQVQEEKIEHLLQAASTKQVTGADLGRIRRIEDAAEVYTRFLIRTLPAGFRLRGIRVAIDCAHGAAYRVGPAVLEELGATVTTIGGAPDGVNINLEQGALHPQRLQSVVRDSGATLGIALDGDADRVLLVDGSGSVLDGDEILAILVDARLRSGNPTATVVGTVMSNMGLEIALKNRGVTLIRASVGDRYVVEEMRRHAATLGAEPSGHVVLLDHHTTGDGLLAALAVCRIILESGRDLTQLRGAVSKLAQVLVNVQLDRPTDLQRLARVQKTIAQVERRLDGRGRVLVRPSGTEPVVRVMVEGEHEDRVRAYAAEIAAAVAEACASESGKEQA